MDRATQGGAILFDSIGVTLVPSPRYLQDAQVEEVDAVGRVVIDEAAFWQRVCRHFTMDPPAVDELAARVAAKFCRNLNVWAHLPELSGRFRLMLIHSGARALVSQWDRVYRLGDHFERIVVTGERGRTPATPALYAELAAELGLPVGRCLVVDDEAGPIEAAKSAGCAVYRYGSAHGLIQIVREWGVGSRE